MFFILVRPGWENMIVWTKSHGNLSNSCWGSSLKTINIWWCFRKNQVVPKVIEIHPLGTMNVCTKFCATSSSRFYSQDKCKLWPGGPKRKVGYHQGHLEEEEEEDCFIVDELKAIGIFPSYLHLHAVTHKCISSERSEQWRRFLVQCLAQGHLDRDGGQCRCNTSHPSVTSSQLEYSPLLV